MKDSKTYNITPNLKLLDLCPPIAGYEKFIGAYLFYGESNAIVDIGPRTTIPNLISTLVELSINPAEIDYIILTHIHIDHAGGAGTALKEMNKAKVVAHSRARSHLINPTLLWKSSLKTLGELAMEYGDIEPIPKDRIFVATDLMKLNLGRDLKLELYLTPGHAPHHLSLFDRANGVLIAGEAAGVCVNGIIRLATPPPFRLEETLSSINRLIALKPAKICYGHFGCYDNALEKLTLVRQRLLVWYEIVTSAAKAGKNSEDILTMLRERDISLDYLNKLGEAEYRRELTLLINSVEGLSGAVGES
jgi:glyoxylase-like metal-dependent hydrolase (beta-lactamase superfamily II)